MAPNTNITLHDLPTTLPGKQPISPFTCIVRYALNYRELAFKTEWRSWQDVESVAKSLGAKPTTVRADGSPRYTVPFIVDETSGTPVVISDSMDIIQYIEKTYPDPTRPLLDSSPVAQGLNLIATFGLRQITITLRTPLMFSGLCNVLPDNDKEYFANLVTGGKGFAGVQAITVAPGSAEYKAVIGQARDHLTEFAGYFARQPEQTEWFGGEKPVYLDFALLGFLNYIRFVRPDVWDDLKDVGEGRFERFLKAGEKYTEIH